MPSSLLDTSHGFQRGSLPIDRPALSTWPPVARLRHHAWVFRLAPTALNMRPTTPPSARAQCVWNPRSHRSLRTDGVWSSPIEKNALTTGLASPLTAPKPRKHRYVLATFPICPHITIDSSNRPANGRIRFKICPRHLVTRLARTPTRAPDERSKARQASSHYQMFIPTPYSVDKVIADGNMWELVVKSVREWCSLVGNGARSNALSRQARLFDG